MGLYRKFFLVLPVILLLISAFNIRVNGEENRYIVADAIKGQLVELETFQSFNSALNYYDDHVDDYDNLTISDQGKIIKMEYGVVAFTRNDEATLNTQYQSLINNSSSVLNASNGIDGAYVGSDRYCQNVQFRIAGDLGECPIEDVTLIPYEMLDVKTSAYVNNKGKLYHLIKTQLESDYFGRIILLDNAPEYLEENKYYYSYDGHYFYDDYKVMSDDYRNNTNDNALNDSPYYNYYQFLSYRSLSNYKLEDIEKYFYDLLKIRDKIYYYDDQVKDGANDIVNRSQLFNEYADFIEMENCYGVNALISLAIAVEDSSYGKNEASFLNNNLFAYSAYTSNEEKENNRYNSIYSGVKNFVKYYLSDKYAYYRSGLYNGAYLGDKSRGLNKEYSYDPYWSEKVASFYFDFDEKMGRKDYNSYTLGIIEGKTNLNFYDDADLTNLIFKQKVINGSLIILGEEDNSYLVALEDSGNAEYKYDFEKRMAYVSKGVFSTVLNKEKMHVNDMVTYNYFTDEKKEIKTLSGHELTISNLNLPGKEFVGFKEKEDENGNIEYVAEYKEIDNVKVIRGFNVIEEGGNIDLRNALLNVVYSDGSSKQLSINSNMVSPIDTEDDNSITISYLGVETTYNIELSSQPKELREKISELILKNIETYKSSGTYHADEIKTIKKNFGKTSYSYDIDVLRDIDGILLEQYRNSAYYCIDENNYDLSISGLTLSLADKNITSLFKPFKDTYYVHVRSVDNADKNKLSEIAAGYGFRAKDFFDISYSLNMQSIEQNGAVIISIAPENKSLNKIYSVYRLDENGDIVKCKTIQSSNRIQFLTKESGVFALLEKDGFNTYNLPDYKENITAENSDPDNHDLFIMGVILMALIIYGTVLIIINYDLDKQKEKLYRDYRNLLIKLK